MSESITTGFYCKYNLPCGYCELKKEQCTCFSYTIPKPLFDPKRNNVVSVYGCPTWETTCTAERDEDAVN